MSKSFKYLPLIKAVTFKYDTREPGVRKSDSLKTILLYSGWYDNPHHWSRRSNNWKDTTHKTKQYLRHRRN